MAQANQVYGAGVPKLTVLRPPIPFINAPTTSQTQYEIGQQVFVKSTKTFYEYAGGGTWLLLASNTAQAGSFTTLTVSGLSSLTTLSVSGLSTLTGGINTAPVVVASGASPLTANGRSGQVTFSGVSIAAGATQSFVINNTAIAAIGTVILYSMSGATAGAALSIVSVTNVAATSSTIVVTNGTGATTTTADIKFTFLVLN